MTIGFARGAAGGAFLSVLIAVNPALAQTTTTGASGWSSEASAAMQQQGCDPTVVSNIATVQDANIRAQTYMAHQLYDYVKATSYSVQSCLSSMLPHLIFGQPSLSNLWSMIGNMVCSEINNLADPTMETITSGMSSFEGSLNNSLYSNLTLGNGAMNLGSVPMGISIGGSAPLINNAAIGALYDNTVNGSFNYGNSTATLFNQNSLINIGGISQ